MKTEKIEWKFPTHLERFRPLISNTGGNSVEDLMDTYLNDTMIMKTNFVRGSLAMMVAVQVGLLEQLYNKGHLI